MPTAAVPEYLQRQRELFQQASPAQRFGLLLPVWTTAQDQETETHRRAEGGSREADEIRRMIQMHGPAEAARLLVAQGRLPGLWEKWNGTAEAERRGPLAQVTKLGSDDKARLDALLQRQEALRSLVEPAALLFAPGLSVAPFTTGLGNEHPLENGFAFLSPYGLPYLAGSGVKGVLRSAARQLARGDWGDPQGWSDRPQYSLHLGGGEVLPLTMLDVLFGRETEPGDTDHVRGVLSFWDVIPRIKGDALQIEVMTPHQSHYLQPGRGASDSPHDSGQPNPITWLAVPPGSQMNFHVICDLGRLGRLAPDLAQNDRWKNLIQSAFTLAFDWLGFGAKTAVGYGRIQNDGAAAQAWRDRLTAAASARAEAERIAAMDPLEREFEEMTKSLPADERLPRLIRALTEEKRWQGEAGCEAARRIQRQMKADGKWQEPPAGKAPKKVHLRTQAVKDFIDNCSKHP